MVVLIGKRDTGKSFLCRDILYHHRDVPVGQVISGTEGANQFYQKMVPKLVWIVGPIFDRFLVDFGSPNGSKIVQKSIFWHLRRGS